MNWYAFKLLSIKSSVICSFHQLTLKICSHYLAHLLNAIVPIIPFVDISQSMLFTEVSLFNMHVLYDLSPFIQFWQSIIHNLCKSLENQHITMPIVILYSLIDFVWFLCYTFINQLSSIQDNETKVTSCQMSTLHSHFFLLSKLS